MISFRLLKKSSRSRARLGILKTPHGEIETPSLVPVATQATVKGLTAVQLEQTKTQVVIANTFHLHLKPGESVLKKQGGIHNFMQWQKPVMTDSGGFQVFSLGFGRDLHVGKVLKYFPGTAKTVIEKQSQPTSVKITPDGVLFRSPVDGAELFLGPKESIRIQEAIGADIMFAFDECTAPLSSKEYIVHSLARTHRWAKQCLDAKRTPQALFGIVQGSHFKDLRNESSNYIGSLPFDGFGIGGDLGSTKKDMMNILNWTLPYVPESKPRHLLGIGRLEDMESVVAAGIDLFDCTVPTHYARHGTAFVFGNKKLDLTKPHFLNDTKTLDSHCTCMVCQTYTRSYLSHLVRAKEITGLSLLTFHNLFYFNTVVEKLRQNIKNAKL